MRLRTLGGLFLDGSTFARPKALLLLAYLALEGPRHRWQIAELFFGQTRDPLRSLRTTLKILRLEVPGVLDVAQDTLRLAVPCDASALLTQLDADELEESAALYTGPFLDGLHLPDWSAELEEWVYVTREMIALRVQAALLRLAERAAVRAEFTPAARYAEQAVGVTSTALPDPDVSARLYTVLLAGQSPLARRWQQQVEESGAGSSPVPGTVEEARAQWQRAGAGSATSGAVRLPLRATSFVGRERELLEIGRALASPEVRLLTLVGPGGIGKTRLALEVTRTFRPPSGAVFAPLESLSSLEALPETLAGELNVILPADTPGWTALAGLLRERVRLLVLDNFEHLWAEVPLVAWLLAVCPDLKVLVTSRERLGIAAEWVQPVGGLTVPPAGQSFAEAVTGDAVALFARRARRMQPGFQLTPGNLPVVQRIAERVGGSPLALELAAAWVRLMPPEDILTELERGFDFLEASDGDVPARHRSVRALFEQTWARLPPEEQRVLSRLAVFQGGWTREAAAEVAGAGLVTLRRLADRSLIQVTERGRYDLHPLLQQYARERLEVNPEETEAAWAAHGRYVTAFAERAMDAVRQSREERRWREAAQLEFGNIQAALGRWLLRGDAEPALHGLTVLRGMWRRIGRVREARTWFAQALGHEPHGDPQLRASALAVDGELAFDSGEPLEARARLEEALNLYAARGVTEPLPLLLLGVVEQNLGELSRAQARFEAALRGFRDRGHLPGIGSALNNLGALHAVQGDWEKARQAYREALEAKSATGSDVESLLLNLGDLHRRLLERSEARTVLLRALDGLVARGFYPPVPRVFEFLGLLAADERHLTRAAVLFGIASRQRQDDTFSAEPLTPGETQELEARVAEVRRALGEAGFGRAWVAGSGMDLSGAAAYAHQA